MSARAERVLLLETLSWLDSLPTGSAAEPVLSSHSRQEGTQSKGRRVSFADTSFASGEAQLSSDYFDDEDPESYVDQRELNYSELQRAIRKWRRFALDRSRLRLFSSADDKSDLSQMPAWRSFLLVVRALEHWRGFASRCQQEAQTMSKAESFHPSLLAKQRSTLRFWKIFCGHRRRVKRTTFAQWRMYFRRLRALLRLLQRAQVRCAFVTWRRRARWPRVAQQWRIFHLRHGLRAWRLHVRDYPFSVQCSAAALASNHAFRRFFLAWRYTVHEIYQRRRAIHATLSTFLRKSYLRTTWPALRRRLVWFIHQRSQLALAADYHRRASLFLARLRWRRRHLILTTVQRHATAASHFLMRKLLYRWYRRKHFHSVVLLSSGTGRGRLLRDSLLIYLRRFLRRWRQQAQVRRMDRGSQVAYRNCTLRLALQQWNYSTKTARQFFFRPSSRDILSVYSRHKARSRAYRLWRTWFRRRAFWRRKQHRAILSQAMARLWKHSQRCLRRKLLLRRAALRYGTHTCLQVLRRWHLAAETHAALRRKFKLYVSIYRSHALSLFSSLGRSREGWQAAVFGPSAPSDLSQANEEGEISFLSSSLTAAHWTDKATSSLGDQLDSPEARRLIDRNILYRNYRLLHIVWYHWAKIFLPARRARRNAVRRCITRTARHRLASTWQLWRELYEVHLWQGDKLREAIHHWRGWQQARAYYRRLLLVRLRERRRSLSGCRAMRYLLRGEKAGPRALPSYAVHRLFQVWLERSRSSKAMARRCSADLYHVQRHLRILSHAVHQVTTRCHRLAVQMAWGAWRKAIQQRRDALRRIRVRHEGRVVLRGWIRVFNAAVMRRSLHQRSGAAIDENSRSGNEVSSPSLSCTISSIAKRSSMIGDLSYVQGYGRDGEGASRRSLSASTSRASPIASYKIRPLPLTPTLRMYRSSSARRQEAETSSEFWTSLPARSIDKHEQARGYVHQHQRRKQQQQQH